MRFFKKPPAWIWPILLAFAISMASGSSQLAVPDVPMLTWDKLAHFLVFGLLATSILRALPRERYPFAMAMLAAVLTSLLGMADEFHQSMTPGRYLEFEDWVADTAGAFVAVIVYQHWGFYRQVLETRVVQRRERSVAPLNAG